MADPGLPPDRELRVEPTRLRGPRGGRTRALAAGAVVVATITVGLGLAALGSSDRRPSGEAFRSPGAASPAAFSRAPSPAPTSAANAFDWLSLPEPADLAPDELEAGVADRRLDGALVFLRADLVAHEEPCWQGLAAECVIASVPGLDLPIDLAPALVYWEPPPPGSVLVMRPQAGRLVYLGVVHADDPVASMSGLLARRPARPFPMTLAPVGGWLVTDPLGQCTPGPDGAPCPPASPFLADEQPQRDGTVPAGHGATVAIEPGAVGLGTATPWLFGTFLVRHALRWACEAGPASCPVATLGWDVVARLDGVAWFQVTVPSPRDGSATSRGLQP